MKPVTHNGEELSIDHLAPTQIECPCAPIGRNLIIDVIFANHCYTEKYQEDLHQVENIVLTEAEDRHRVFCPIRYELSKGLPELIKALPDAKVHQTSQSRNYVYVVKLEVEDRPYEIYFMLQRADKKAKADLRLTIESAYIDENGSAIRRRPNSIRFFVLAHKVLTNQHVKFAPR